MISACTVAASLDHRLQHVDGPPAKLKSFTSFQMVHTHTYETFAGKSFYTEKLLPREAEDKIPIGIYWSDGVAGLIP